MIEISVVRERVLALMNELAAFALASGIPGIGIAADVGGAPLHVFAGVEDALERYPMTSHSKFRMACVNHGLLAIALQAIRSPRPIDFEESLSTHLAEFSTVDPLGAVRLRHVLSHSTGYDYPLPITMAPEASFGPLSGTPRSVFPPGSYLYYHAMHTFQLEQLLERHTGRSISELLNQHIFSTLPGLYPIDTKQLMDDRTVSGHDRIGHLHSFHPTTRIADPSDLHLSLPALVDVCRAFLYVYEGTASPAILKPMSYLPAGIGVAPYRRYPKAYSLGWAIFESGLYGVNGMGMGQCCAVRFDPAKHISFAVGLPAVDPDFRDKVIDLMEQALGYAKLQSPAGAPAVSESVAMCLPGDYMQTMGERVVSAHVARSRDTISINVREGSRLLPTLDVLRRDTTGKWSAAQGSNLVPVRFYLTGVAEAPGVMIGTTSLWRTTLVSNPRQ